jgi:hypothetical protein
MLQFRIARKLLKKKEWKKKIGEKARNTVVSFEFKYTQVKFSEVPTPLTRFHYSDKTSFHTLFYSIWIIHLLLNILCFVES